MQHSIANAVFWLVTTLTIYLNATVFLSRNYPLIVTPAAESWCSLQIIARELRNFEGTLDINFAGKGQLY